MQENGIGKKVSRTEALAICEWIIQQAESQRMESVRSEPFIIIDEYDFFFFPNEEVDPWGDLEEVP